MHFREYFPVTDVTLNYVSQIKKNCVVQNNQTKKSRYFLHDNL